VVNVQYYVSFDNVQVGKTMGQGLVTCEASKVAKPNVLVMHRPVTDNNATLFYQGYYDQVLRTLFTSGKYVESRLGSIATDIDVGNLVLYPVAAAVIGGTSLFGGRGKMIHALLGGVVIAAVFNGLALMGISAAGVDIATAIVLILAVTVDSVVRRRGATGT